MNTGTVTRFRIALYVRVRSPQWDLKPTGLEIKNDDDLSIAYTVIERRMLGTLREASYYFGVSGLLDQDPGQLVAVSAYITKVKPTQSFSLSPDGEGDVVEVEHSQRVRRVQHTDGFFYVRMALAKRAAQIAKSDYGDLNPSTVPCEWLPDDGPVSFPVKGPSNRVIEGKSPIFDGGDDLSQDVNV